MLFNTAAERQYITGQQTAASADKTVCITVQFNKTGTDFQNIYAVLTADFFNRRVRRNQRIVINDSRRTFAVTLSGI